LHAIYWCVKTLTEVHFVWNMVALLINYFWFKYFIIILIKSLKQHLDWFGFMVFSATFNNISVISWQLVLLMEETIGPRENHRLVTSHWQTLSHNVVHLALIEIQTHNISGDLQHLDYCFLLLLFSFTFFLPSEVVCNISHKPLVRFIWDLKVC
jgi:hypothetical protein